MNDFYVKMYMEIANVISNYSRAEKLKVGSIIVKENRIISIGINGTPDKWESNVCEDIIFNESGEVFMKTKPEVIHAEMNAISKLAKSPESGIDSIMFITHSPCINCAKGIFGAGISKIYYMNEYRSSDGLDFLNRVGISVIKIKV